jgi:LuxR family maltose regulon positive regulatory protein
VLRPALSLAEPENYIRLFVDEGPPMAGLLQLAQAQGISPDYVTKLLKVFQREHQNNHHQPATMLVSSQPLATPSVSLIEPLSDRELEVLQFIAQGFTNQAVAEQLVIAVSTVKSHTNKIFAKLDVQNRTQAVARARELKLI